MMHLLFFVHSQVPTLPPPPPPPSHPSTLLLNRHTALGVTAGITCRASGALHFANGLISCQGHPISPEIDSLSLLSSLSRFCRDSPHECCDDGAQRKSRPVSHGRVWKTCAQPVLFIDAFFFPPLPLSLSWSLKAAYGCLSFENTFLCDFAKCCMPSWKIQIPSREVRRLSRIVDLNRNAVYLYFHYNASPRCFLFLLMKF